MKRASVCVAALLFAAACGSSRDTNDVPNTVPPPQPVESNTPSVQAQIASLQTSMTELLDRLDVLNDRIAKLEAAAAPAPAQNAPPRAAAPQTAAPQTKPAVIVSADIAEDYRQALMLIGQGKLVDARGAFQRVFDADPTGHLADNALFWIAETYYQSRDYPNAMRYYQRVINEYPEENKAPDAMFKLALAYVKTGDLGMARRTLQQCIQKYPYSSPAASAKVELQRIKY